MSGGFNKTHTVTRAKKEPEQQHSGATPVTGGKVASGASSWTCLPWANDENIELSGRDSSTQRSRPKRAVGTYSSTERQGSPGLRTWSSLCELLINSLQNQLRALARAARRSFNYSPRQRMNILDQIYVLGDSSGEILLRDFTQPLSKIMVSFVIIEKELIPRSEVSRTRH